MTAIVCACGNSARYINARGELTCGICPIKEGVDSIRIADVPKLLGWARRYLSWLRGATFDALCDCVANQLKGPTVELQALLGKEAGR